MPRKRQKVPVSERALVQRVNRVLAKQDERLKTYRGGRSIVQLGRYYIVNVKGNWLVSGNVDLEDLGREVECLEAWEYLERGTA